MLTAQLAPGVGLGSAEDTRGHGDPSGRRGGASGELGTDAAGTRRSQGPARTRRAPR